MKGNPCQRRMGTSGMSASRARWSAHLSRFTRIQTVAGEHSQRSKQAGDSHVADIEDVKKDHWRTDEQQGGDEPPGSVEQRFARTASQTRLRELAGKKALVHTPALLEAIIG